MRWESADGHAQKEEKVARGRDLGILYPSFLLSWVAFLLLQACSAVFVFLAAAFDVHSYLFMYDGPYTPNQLSEIMR